MSYGVVLLRLAQRKFKIKCSRERIAILTSKENILHPNKKRDGRERPKVASTLEGM